MVTGLPKIAGLSTKEWQDKAKKDLSPFLKELMGREIPIEYISNATGPRPDAPVRYNVKLQSSMLSKEIRTRFGSFYAAGRDERPAFFKPISIRNLVTQCTRIRIAILQVIGRRYRDSNQGSRVQVTHYDPRPMLRITPPPDASSRRVLTHNYIEAIKKYPTNFRKEDLEFIFSKVGHKQKGQLRSLFVCVNDDMLSSIRQLKTRGPNNSAQGSAAEAGNESDNDDIEMSTSVPPQMVPPPSGSRPTVPQPTGSKSGNSSHSSQKSGGSGRNSFKRGAPSPAESQPEKSSRV